MGRRSRGRPDLRAQGHGFELVERARMPFGWAAVDPLDGLLENAQTPSGTRWGRNAGDFAKGLFQIALDSRG